jgi:hypothetical protein
MATWHQQRNPIKLYSDSRWVIVNDPPNDCRTLTTCATEEQARETLARWRENNPEAHRHCYILPPATVSDPRRFQGE